MAGNSDSGQRDDVPERYARDGFYIAHRLLGAAECAALKSEALRVLAERGSPKATVLVGVACHSPIYYRLASDPRIVAILQRIMPGGISFMSDKFVFKSGVHRFATPWHCDRAYWANTRPKLSVWIPLDDCSAFNGTLTVVRCSHTRDWPHVRGGIGPGNEFGNVIRDTAWPAEDVVVCECERGSAVFFPDSLVHGSCENTAGSDRYTIIGTYHAPAPDEPFDVQFPARHVIRQK